MVGIRLWGGRGGGGTQGRDGLDCVRNSLPALDEGGFGSLADFRFSRGLPSYVVPPSHCFDLLASLLFPIPVVFFAASPRGLMVCFGILCLVVTCNPRRICFAFRLV